jgi:CTP:molybdopterin cytidylyltransferase MocA
MDPMEKDAVDQATTVAAVLLAAGGGRRLGGRPKALLSHHGRPLVEHAVRVLREGGCAPDVHVVLGAGADDVRRRADLTGCVVLENRAWAEGMGTSLRLGLRALAWTRAHAALVFLVDQPDVGPAAVARVRAAYRSPGTLAAASYDGRRGHPVLLGAAHWAGVAEDASGDRGARGYLGRHSAETRLVECGDVADPADVDTPADLGRLAP